MGHFLGSGAGGLGRWLGIGPSLLVPFLIAATLVTIAALVVVVTATIGPSRRWTTVALRLLAAAMVLNVVVPHAPAAVIVGGYVPGLVTALLVNLPVATVFLVRGGVVTSR